MKKKWLGLIKVTEECGELIQELMKLHNYPDGKHPRRKRSLKISVQEEAGDVQGLIRYFAEKNGLDLAAIEKRALSKYRKYNKKYGPTPVVAKAKKKQSKKKTAKRQAKQIAKIASEVVLLGDDASTHRVHNENVLKVP